MKKHGLIKFQTFFVVPTHNTHYCNMFALEFGDRIVAATVPIWEEKQKTKAVQMSIMPILEKTD